VTPPPADPAPGPDTGSHEVIHLGGQAAVVVPVTDFLRLRALELHASADELEDARDAAAPTDWKPGKRPAGPRTCPMTRCGLRPIAERAPCSSCRPRGVTGEPGRLADRLLPDDLKAHPGRPSLPRVVPAVGVAFRRRRPRRHRHDRDAAHLLVHPAGWSASGRDWRRGARVGPAHPRRRRKRGRRAPRACCSCGGSTATGAAGNARRASSASRGLRGGSAGVRACRPGPARRRPGWCRRRCR
jgi:hypothetical protein